MGSTLVSFHIGNFPVLEEIILRWLLLRLLVGLLIVRQARI